MLSVKSAGDEDCAVPQLPGLNTSRAFGDVAAQQLGLSSAPAMQAFELTAQDAFVVRSSCAVISVAVERYSAPSCDQLPTHQLCAAVRLIHDALCVQ